MLKDLSHRKIVSLQEGWVGGCRTGPAYQALTRRDIEETPYLVKTCISHMPKQQNTDTFEKELAEDFKRKDWTREEWKSSPDPLDRIADFISYLSPHNLWKSREAIRELLAAQSKADKARMEKILRKAYRAGQASVSCMKVVHGGAAKPSHFCDDELCKHEVSEETNSAEDAVIKALEESTTPNNL